jgi:hypothetical protein
MSSLPPRPAMLTAAQLRRLESRGPSPLPTFLRRLGWIVALVLGGGSVVAAICSVSLALTDLALSRISYACILQRTILPLLWSSFSARQAITDQQLHGAIGAHKFYRSIPSATAVPTNHEDNTLTSPAASEKGTTSQRQLSDSLLIEDMSDAERRDRESKLSNGEVMTHPERNTFFQMRSGLEELPSLLEALKTGLSATSTTRTSLLSTITSYNSTLHTQDFMSNARGGSRNAIGLKTTDQAQPEEFVIGRPAPEFEELRKEVRSLKGLLLSR